MVKEELKINRRVKFMHAIPFVENGQHPENNTWWYNRAPEGYKFILHSAVISNAHVPYTSTGIVAIFDGHEYTGWNIFPGVESMEMLGRFETSAGETQGVIDLNGWECKEYTVASRSLSGSLQYKCCVIIWYFLEKMSDFETKQYAVMQPKGEHIRKSGMTTIELDEE